MADIDQKCLDEEIADARITLNHNIVERIKAEANLEELRETIAATRGAINAFEYLLQRKLEEAEPQTPKPDDSGSGEEA